MKIVFVVNNLAFFVSHRLPIALNALSRGFEVTVITGRAGSKAMEVDAQKKLHATNVKHIMLPFDTSGISLLRELRGFLALVYTLFRLRPDLVHCVSPKGIIYGGLASRIVNVKALVLAVSGQGSVFTDVKRSLLMFFVSKVYLFFLKLILKHRNYKVIVQNVDDFDFYNVKLKVSSSCIKLIPGSGVDLTQYSSKRSDIKEKIVLLPARMLRDKGVVEFYDACRILRHEFNDWRFVLVGAADYDNPSSIGKKQIEEWVAEGSVEWLGYRHDMNELYQSARIVCLPSYREGLPKALIEAAAAQCAIVTTDVTGCRDAIVKGITGLLVESNDSQSLYRGLKRLMLNPVMCSKFGMAGRSRAIEHFDLETVLSSTFKIYSYLYAVSNGTDSSTP